MKFIPVKPHASDEILIAAKHIVKVEGAGSTCLVTLSTGDAIGLPETAHDFCKRAGIDRG